MITFSTLSPSLGSRTLVAKMEELLIHDVLIERVNYITEIILSL